jgi:hypothetical protein
MYSPYRTNYDPESGRPFPIASSHIFSDMVGPNPISPTGEHDLISMALLNAKTDSALPSASPVVETTLETQTNLASNGPSGNTSSVALTSIPVPTDPNIARSHKKSGKPSREDKEILVMTILCRNKSSRSRKASPRVDKCASRGTGNKRFHSGIKIASNRFSSPTYRGGHMGVKIPRASRPYIRPRSNPKKGERAYWLVGKQREPFPNGTLQKSKCVVNIVEIE